MKKKKVACEASESLYAKCGVLMRRKLWFFFFSPYIRSEEGATLFLFILLDHSN